MPSLDQLMYVATSRDEKLPSRKVLDHTLPKYMSKTLYVDRSIGTRMGVELVTVGRLLAVTYR
jgi:hypothetical protein